VRSPWAYGRHNKNLRKLLARSQTSQLTGRTFLARSGAGRWQHRPQAHRICCRAADLGKSSCSICLLARGTILSRACSRPPLRVRCPCPPVACALAPRPQRSLVRLTAASGPPFRFAAAAVSRDPSNAPLACTAAVGARELAGAGKRKRPSCSVLSLGRSSGGGISRLTTQARQARNYYGRDVRRCFHCRRRRSPLTRNEESGHLRGAGAPTNMELDVPSARTVRTRHAVAVAAAGSKKKRAAVGGKWGRPLDSIPGQAAMIRL
jgi:hypothetical protein